MKEYRFLLDEKIYQTLINITKHDISTYVTDLGFNRSEFADVGVTFTDKKWNEFNQMVEKFDRLVETHKDFDLIMPEEILYSVQDFIDSRETISSRLESEDISYSKKTEKLVNLVDKINQLIRSEDIYKAKYLKRTGSPGNYKYVYKEKKGRKKIKVDDSYKKEKKEKKGKEVLIRPSKVDGLN